MVRKQGEQGEQREQRENENYNGPSNRGQKNVRDRGEAKENYQSKNRYRDRGPKQNSPYPKPSYQSSVPRYNNKPRMEETVDDIKEDISRIEKEIQLELKEIRSLKLGL